MPHARRAWVYSSLASGVVSGIFLVCLSSLLDGIFED